MTKISASIPVNYANVHWFQSVNLRKSAKSFGNPLSDIEWRIERDEKSGEEKILNQTKDGLVYALRDGWDQTQGAITVERATKETAARAVEDRKRIIAELEKDESQLPLAVTLKDLWFPNGKAVPVEFIGNNCYRRSVGIQGVLLRRRREQPDGWDKEFTVYVVPKDFGTDDKGQDAKLDDHLAENLLKDVGRKMMQPVDFFHAAIEKRRLRGANARESDLVKLGLKRGEAQRAFALAAINSDFAELNLAARSSDKLAPPSDKPYIYVPFKSYVDVSKLRHADVVSLNQGNVPGVKTPDGKPKKIPGGRKGILNAIESYIKDAMTGGKVTALTSTKIGETASKSPAHVLQYLAGKIAKNDGNFAELFGKHADRINKALAFLVKEDKDYATIVEQEKEGEKEGEKAA